MIRLLHHVLPTNERVKTTTTTRQTDNHIYCSQFILTLATEKIYAISDLHVDQAENMKWIEGLSDEKYLNDTIIVAG